MRLVPRQSDRKIVKMAVILFVESDGELEKHEALTLDLSTHGARIQSNILLRPGQVVEVVPGEGAIPVPGRVVWVGKPASDLEGQAGLEFLDLFDITR